MTDELSTKTRVVAIVAPGAYNNARYDFNFSDWKPFDNSDIMYFAREFECSVNDSELLKSIDEIQRIILALFLCDSIPRKIHFFEYGENLSEQDRTKFWRVFGQPRTHFETEQIISSKSFMRFGLFNPTPLLKIDFVDSEYSVKSWFEFLSRNPHVSSSLQLIQESFGLAHELYAGFRIINFTELSTVLLLLISGLESIFTNQSAIGDISFKFRTVGAAYYSKYVDESSLANGDTNQGGKFKFTEFRDILGILYDLRSSIAHGEFNLTFFNKKERIRKPLDTLFSLVGVGAVNQDMRSIYFAHLLLAIGLLENHILAIFRSAKENLNKGVNILDEMLENNDSGQRSDNI